MQQLKPSATLQSGKYQIIRTLGQGGFGITYLAKNTMLNGQVAIKEFFMKGCCERDEHTTQITVPTRENQTIVDRFKQKFVKEAQSLFRLSHPNIVRIHDIFEENGTAYYVMEYAEGGSLAALVKAQGALPQPVATRYILQIADALTYIHQRKMNHLDVKPANIMLNHQDESILIDFGLAKQYDASTGEQTSSTPVGISEGYAPMEQYKQGGVGVFSPETDVYSLGATYYKLLTGLTPPSAFDIDDQGVPVSELRAKGVSNLVINLICQAMEPRKRDRLHSVRAFIDGLKGIPVASDPTTSDNEETELHGNDIDDEETDIKNEPKTKPKPQLQTEPQQKTEPKPKPQPKPEPKPKPESKPRHEPSQTAGNSNKKYWIPISLVAFLLFGWIIWPKGSDSGRNETAEAAKMDEVAEKQSILPAGKPNVTKNGHIGVDLGTTDEFGQTIYWATCNVGATNPWDNGLYFAWGETKGYIPVKGDLLTMFKEHEFSWSSYKLCKGTDHTLTKYCSNGSYGKTDFKTVLESADDAATTNWGSSWRMPTMSELRQLQDSCYWQWVRSYQEQDVRGYIIYRAKSASDKGKKNYEENRNTSYSESDSHIFLPAAGYGESNLLIGIDEGHYWSNSIGSNSAEAYNLSFGVKGTFDYSRYMGRSVRPVCQ